MSATSSCALFSPEACRSRYEPSVCPLGPWRGCHGRASLAVSQPNQPPVGRLCGGLAEYFKIDATLIPVLFIVFAVLGGPGLLADVLLWIISRTASRRGVAVGGDD